MKNSNFTIKSLVFCLFIFGVFLQNTYADGWTSVKIDSLLDIENLVVTVNSSNQPYLIYEDATNHNLKIGVWNGNYFDFSIVDEDVWGGSYVIAFKPDGNPAVLYYEGPTSTDIKYGEFDGTSWTTTETGIFDGETKGGASLVIDNSGTPHICFEKYSTIWELYYASFDGTTWTSELIEEGLGGSNTIALGSDGTLHIASGSKYIKKASGGSWEIEEIENANVASRPFINLMSDGNPCIGYCDGDKVQFAHYDETSWQINEVGGIGYGSVGYVTMDLDGSDNAHYTLYRTYTLRHIKWDGTTAVETDIEMIESTGQNPNIASGSDGSVHIVYGNKYVSKGTGTAVNMLANDFLNVTTSPNPFNNSTTIKLDEQVPENVNINIYNSLGQKVKTLEVKQNQIIWEGDNNSGCKVNQGIYFLVLESNRKMITRKIIKQ